MFVKNCQLSKSGKIPDTFAIVFGGEEGRFGLEIICCTRLSQNFYKIKILNE